MLHIKLSMANNLLTLLDDKVAQHKGHGVARKNVVAAVDVLPID